MRTVFIADDEENICYLIKKLIDWDGLDLSFAGMAYDGRSALEQIQALRPDIVITDVRMPDVDGLSMIQMAREEVLKITFIVVSGHQEFEYAYRALKYGVEDYLLKPVKKKEINEILRKIISRMDQEQAFAASSQELKKTNAAQKQLLRDQFIKIVREQPSVIDSVETVRERYGCSFVSPAAFCAIAVKVDILPNCIGQVQTDFMIRHLVNLTEKAISPFCSEFVYSAEDSVLCAVLNGYEIRIENPLQDLLKEMRMYAGTMECYRVSLALSDEVGQLADLPQAIRQAQMLLGNRIFEDGNKILRSGSRPLGSSETNDELLPVETRYRIRRAAEALDTKAMRDQIRTAIHALEWDEKRSAAAYFRLADLIADYAFRTMEEHVWGRDYVAGERSQIPEYLNHASSVRDLGAILAERLSLVMEQCEKERKQSTGRPIRLACSYIEEHLSEKITLEQTAEQAGLSPAYFSQLFKQETGETFSDYLINRRIERAKKLLLQTDDTIVSVMEQAGYRDMKYFRNLFTEKVGVTPVKYRKLNG